MKILQINSVYKFGSTGRIAGEINKTLQAGGHEGLVCYGRMMNGEETDGFYFGGKWDNERHAILTRLTDKHGFYSKKATYKLIKRIEDYGPDIIHLHNIHGYYLNVELLFEFLRDYRAPIVWTLHDCWALTGHCAHFDYIGCSRWQTGCYNCPQKKRYPASILKDNSKANYQRKKQLFNLPENMTIVTPSKWLAGIVRESFLQKFNVRVINNGIDLAQFQPRESGFRQRNGLENKFIILGVASVWEERKGLDYFLRMAGELDEDCRIVIVGADQGLTRKFPQNVTGIERTDSAEQLAEIYTAADVFVNPTLEDNFPTTNLEALACGTPVITFRTGGSPESLDENSGIVVPKGDGEALLDAIGKLKAKPFLEVDCLNRGRQFSKEQRFEEYIRLYEGLI